jgi:hypothetical protein
MSRNKSREQYGTFLVRSKKWYKHKPIQIGVILILIFGTLGITWFFTYSDSQVELVELPVAKASEFPDWWLKEYFGSSVCESRICEPDEDPDSDGLTNVQEYNYKTDPFRAYTIQDEMTDGELVAAGFDPSLPGRKRFEDLEEQAASLEVLTDESLVFDEDVRKLIAESLDFSSKVIPLADSSEFKITADQTHQAYQKYFDDLNSNTQKYFSESELSLVLSGLNSGSDQDAESLRFKASFLARDLKSMTVPRRMEKFHRYLLVLYELIPEVLADSTRNPDLWYDKAEAFIAVQQKLSFEQYQINRDLGL